MAQETGHRDPFINKKMKELSDIYKMYQNTSGDVKEMWRNKWYQLIRIIAVRIRQLRQNYDK
jgi:hypothetical protein